MGPQQERLLAFLAVHEWPSRYVIASLLWPDSTDESALAALRTAIWRLQSRAPGVLDASQRTLRLTHRMRVDVHECINWAQRVLAGPERLTDNELAIPVPGAELLPSWDEHWLEPERHRVRQMRIHALETAAAEQLRRGNPGAAALSALTALHTDPLRESTHRVLVQIHLAERNVRAALDQYHQCRHVLRAEVGVPPSRELTALVADYLPAETT